MTVIRNATLPAALADGVPAGPVDITLDGATMVAVTAHDPTRTDGLDATGLVVVPGLVDTHVHVRGREHLDMLRDHGVTTAVDLAAWPDEMLSELKALTGTCSLLSAGTAASAPGGHQTELLGAPKDSVVTGPDDAERFVAARVAGGADVIKVIVEDERIPGNHYLTPPTLAALVDSAHAHDRLAVGHVVTKHACSMGLDAGLDVLTHAPLNEPVDDDQVQRMLDQGAVCSPTLVMLKGVAAARAGAPGPRLSLDHAVESVRRMHAAGVPIVAGTDANDSPGSPSPVEHGSSLHDELELLVAAGLSPAEAMVAATSGAATALRLADRGAVAPGLRADLLLLEADPTADIRATRRIAQVWVAGERVR